MPCSPRSGDFATARDNLEAALEYQSPEGNLACLRTTSEEWIDRSQSPIGAYVLWRLFEMTGDRSLLAEHFPTLFRAIAGGWRGGTATPTG